MRRAADEIDHWAEYEYVLVNRDMDACLDQCSGDRHGGALEAGPADGPRRVRARPHRPAALGVEQLQEPRCGEKVPAAVVERCLGLRIGAPLLELPALVDADRIPGLLGSQRLLQRRRGRNRGNRRSSPAATGRRGETRRAPPLHGSAARRSRQAARREPRRRSCRNRRRSGGAPRPSRASQLSAWRSTSALRPLGAIAGEIGFGIAARPAANASRSGATRSIAALARPVSGMARGSISSPTLDHSSATAFANCSVGSSSGARAGVRTGRPSSRTPQPSPSGSTETAFQKGFTIRRYPYVSTGA